MASDALFQALAGALSRPSHAYRTAEAAMDIPMEAVKGYEAGSDIASNMRARKFLNTPLSDVFGDANRIPYGLKANHTVNDLVTLSKSLTGYIPPEVASLALGLRSPYGLMPGAAATPSAGGSVAAAAPGASGPPAQPSPVSGPSRPPAMTPTDPNAGIRAISGDNVDPGNVAGGAPIPGSGGPIRTNPVLPPSGPGNVPGMSGKALQLVTSAMDAATRNSQFNSNQRRETDQFNATYGQRDLHHQQDLDAARGRATATNIATHIAPTMESLGTAQALAAQLAKFTAQDQFVPLVGGKGPAVAEALGNYGPDLATNKLRIKNVGNALGIQMNKIFVNRYNDAERRALQDSLIPGPNDPLKDEKMARLRGLLDNLRQGKVDEAEMILDSLSGRRVNPANLGTSGGAAGGGTPPPPGNLSAAAQAYLSKNNGPTGQP